MKRRFLSGALLLFGLSVLSWLAMTAFETSLLGMSLGGQRLITFALLVVPTAAGAVLGVMSLRRREGRAWLAILAIVLNVLFALFFLMIVFFAG